MPDLQNEKAQLENLNRYIQEKNYSNAFELGEKLLEDFPFSFQIKFSYARLLRQSGRLSDAKNFLYDLDRLYPFNISVLMELSETLFQLKEYSESLTYFNRVLFLDSFNENAKNRVGEIQELLRSTTSKSMDSMEGETGTGAAPTQSEDDLSVIQIHENNDQEKDSYIAMVNGGEVELKKEIQEKDKQEMKEDKEEEERKKKEKQAETENPSKEQELKITPVVEVRSDTTMSNSPDSTKIDEEIPFITQSAAELYERQGLYAQARMIYRRLYEQTGDEEYIQKIMHIDRTRIQKRERVERIVSALKQFLSQIQNTELRNV